ncbi:hypothetical protein GCM10010387_09540 [Streptomyces inusitatus]|uniref:Uncharacterized protein n=1 Tax=Streptomyces inusitatus TaxID=68221 RepID=A0A918PQ92_9ACTN|nr:hypothetical protein GCM10010387_09540 [Streptomyces inusitatus]
MECRRSPREAGVGFAGQRGLLERNSGTAGKGEADGSDAIDLSERPSDGRTIFTRKWEFRFM